MSPAAGPSRDAVLLLGSTDLTLRVAEALRDAGVPIAAWCHVGAAFSISYSRTQVTNTRHTDPSGWCAAHGVPEVRYQPPAPLADALAGIEADLALVAGWYHMIPADVRQRFRCGCLGLHASLLPQLRGGAPLNWAILTDLPESGVSLFTMADGVDDGPIVGVERFSIDPRDDVSDLIEKCAVAAESLVRTRIPGVLAGTVRGVPQQGVPTYALQRTPEDGWIDWTRPAVEIDRLVRAVTRPYPGAWSVLGGRRITIWKARPAAADVVVHGAAGQLFRHPVAVTLDPGCPADRGAAVGVVTGAGLLWIESATDEDGADALPGLARMSQQRFSGR